MDMTRHYHDLYGEESKDQKIKRLDAEIEQLREQRDLAVVTSIERAQEIERLREALKETLAVAKRNEIGDYIQRAEALLQQKEAE